ncbi:MAG TPA: hypothetical protein VKW78_18430 [Terriglobales bacterium]|nr:hypothetical protein [Terriglobales bacterium]
MLKETGIVYRLQKSRGWKTWGWACVLFLLLMNSAQVMHFCGLQGELRPQRGHDVAATSIDHTFCVICASIHSPSLVSPVVSLLFLDGPAAIHSSTRTIERSAAPVFTLYIRPPPAC